MKDPQFQNDLEKKLKNISEKSAQNDQQRRECYSIGSPNLEWNSRDPQSDPTVIFKLIKNTFRFKGRQSHRNCWTSTIRSKNDSFNEEEKTNGFRPRFDRLEAIIDNEDAKFNQVTSLETQELLASKLADLEDYHS